MGLKAKVIERQLKKMEQTINNLPPAQRKHVEKMIAETKKFNEPEKEQNTPPKQAEVSTLDTLKQQMLDDLKEKYVEINLMPDFDEFAGNLFDIYAKHYALEKYEEENGKDT